MNELASGNEITRLELPRERMGIDGGVTMELPSTGLVHAVPVIDIVNSSGWLAETLYRGFEILAALLGLLIGLPLMLIEAGLICWDSPGSPIFFHERVARSTTARGRDLEGRTDLRPPPGGYQRDALYYTPGTFRFVKFRTMFKDARQRFPQLYDMRFTPEEFPLQRFKIENDPRVTRVGRILRRYTLDEVPNLWSVLVGDIRLVGPRPELPAVLQYYHPDQMYKFACKPGITGLAQINGRGLLTWGQTLELDLQYIRTRTVWLDLKIIFITLNYVITRRGAF